MSNQISYRDFAEATTLWGGAIASAWTEGAKNYTAKAELVLQQSGQTVLTETQRVNIFVTEQIKVERALVDTANTWATSAAAAGKNGIADIMRKYAEKVYVEADKVLTGVITEKQWLDRVVAEANVKIEAAKKVVDYPGGTAAKVVGPIVDAAQMIAGASEYVQTGSSDSWENACAGVALSWGAAALTVFLIPTAAPAMLVVGLAALAAGAGSYFGGQYFQDWKNSLLNADWFINGFDKFVGPLVNTLFGNAQNWRPRYDPLVLDLDGNGITTSAINPAAPILFDQDGDGTLTATGWIGAGEALVVRDLNGNGKIDSGRELFGDSTVLTSGPRIGEKAANGFEALADLDSSADGKFDASDAAFASVKLWKDANQNGISEAGELFTFNQLGVASINVSGTATNIDLGGGNTQSLAGSFTRTTGQTGNAGTASLAGSLLLASNNFYREFTDDPVVTSAAQALPQMQGSSWSKRCDAMRCDAMPAWRVDWRMLRKKELLAQVRRAQMVDIVFKYYAQSILQVRLRWAYLLATRHYINISAAQGGLK